MMASDVITLEFVRNPSLLDRFRPYVGMHKVRIGDKKRVDLTVKVIDTFND